MAVSTPMGLAIVALLTTLTSCAATFPGYMTLEPGTYEHNLDMRISGFRRSYLIHIPKGYNPARPAPLVVALHGAFSTARKMEAETGLSELADRAGFITLYPNGITLFGLFQHWNAGHCCGKAMKDQVDDVGFVSSVIDQARVHLNVDSRRIYVVGYSNGAMLAYLVAAKRPETLAAVAAIASTIGSRPSPSEPEARIPTPSAPVPAIAFHGREDDNIPYDGGDPSRTQGHLYVSVTESMNFWAKSNRCATPATAERLMDGRVLRETWTGSQRDGEVILYTIEGWKHDLPTHYYTDRLPATDPLNGFHATDIIWDFFKRHSK
jgi:polyhydroxybutyrate depolymerase